MPVKEYFNSVKTRMHQSVFTRHLLHGLLYLLVLLTYLSSNAEGSFASEVFRIVAEGIVAFALIKSKRIRVYCSIFVGK